jgi:hypothetical protein
MKNVHNVADPEATTHLGARTEYWNDPPLFKRIHRSLRGERATYTTFAETRATSGAGA